ncbi:MAG TPA: hypothetical protein VE775_11770 [Pyrinomonadaceae bacterium]|nr:hypothetical protein [Pyrinomonadaceae bacterium]
MTRQQVNRTTLRALVLVALCACLVGLLGPRATRGANPPSGIITLANTATNPVNYTAGPFLVPNPSGAVALQCTPTLPCDDYFLTVNIPDAYVDTHEVRARFSWTSPGADFDIVVYKNNRIFGQAGSSSMPE